jgi:hypothetical protein
MKNKGCLCEIVAQTDTARWYSQESFVLDKLKRGKCGTEHRDALVPAVLHMKSKGMAKGLCRHGECKHRAEHDRTEKNMDMGVCEHKGECEHKVKAWQRDSVDPHLNRRP